MKLLSISCNFLKAHPKSGQPTFFVEKITAGVGVANFESQIREISNEGYLYGEGYEPKCLTMRELKAEPRFKIGEQVCLFYWSGKPYRSATVKFGIVTITDIGIVAVSKKRAEIEIWNEVTSAFVLLNEEQKEILIKLDGFDNQEDFFDWHGESKAQYYAWAKTPILEKLYIWLGI